MPLVLCNIIECCNLKCRVCLIMHLAYWNVCRVTNCVQHWNTERVLWLWSKCDQGYSPLRVHIKAEFPQKYVSWKWWCVIMYSFVVCTWCASPRNLYQSAVIITILYRGLAVLSPEHRSFSTYKARIRRDFRFIFPPHSSAYQRLTSGLTSRPRDGVRISLH